MKLGNWSKSLKICAVLLWIECIVATYLPDEAFEARTHAMHRRHRRPPGPDEGPQTPAAGSKAPDPALSASIGVEGMALLAKMVCSQQSAHPSGAAAQRGAGGLPGDSGEPTDALVSEPPEEPANAANARRDRPARTAVRSRQKRQ